VGLLATGYARVSSERMIPIPQAGESFSPVEGDRRFDFVGEHLALVHSVNRVLRTQVAIFNSLIENLKRRRQMRKNKTHPEVLDAVSRTVERAKTFLNDTLRKEKQVRSMLKTLQSNMISSSDATLREARSILIDMMGYNTDQMKDIGLTLSQQKSGIYSRREKLGDIINNLPERLAATLSEYSFLRQRVSALESLSNKPRE
jgi:hypothetical protein